MRTFIALEVPEEFEHEVAGVVRTLAPLVPGRFMKQETYHLTLAFIGEVGEVQARDAMDALDVACADMEPVTLRCTGLGRFGRTNDATLWLGIDDRGPLNELARRVRDALAACGVPYDEKPFRAHITLARRARLPKGALPELAFPQPTVVRKVTLFKSILAPEGARYKPLYTVELTAD